MMDLSHLQIRNPKDDETSLEASTQIYSSLLPSYIPWRKRIFSSPPVYSFELFLLNQTVYFYITSNQKSSTLIQSLILSSFPSIKVKKTTDPVDLVLKSEHIEVGEMVLAHSFTLPTKTYADFKDVDPLASLLGYLSKRQPHERMGLQLLVSAASFPWVSTTIGLTKSVTYDSTGVQKETQNPNKTLMMQKASFQGGKALIRIMAGSSTAHGAKGFLHNIAGTFGAFSLGGSNQYSLKKPWFAKDKLLSRFKERKTTFFERRYQILNSQELATLWHPPGKPLSGIKNLAWGKTLAGEPPENLPAAKNLSEDEKKDINFFATTEFKSEEQIFGIRSVDRRKHMYVVGKTGAGKSTLIANMAIDDIRKDRGVGVIDPHGDLSEIILDYIPNRRMQDVIYLEPFDTERPFHLNVLETMDGQHKDLITSGIVSIFNKLYKESWGPRLEYILRNVIMTLLEIPNSTLADVLPLLSQPDYRRKVIPLIKDPVIKSFWIGEFDKMPDRLKAEAINPIQNKVGQFVSSTMIRNIIGHPKSTINLQEIMDNKKIIILNLSQGKLGEDNAALLGAMIINQIQLTAMRRAFYKEEDRKDFFLYVDEFQNFATSSFVKILSEARKYRLSLTLANQYIEQLELPIQTAIFGNIGTLISFVVGARDGYLLSREFGEMYSESDMVSMGKFETVLKLSIDNMTSRPFPAKTLPLPSLKNDNRDKIIRLSKEKYGRKVEPMIDASLPVAQAPAQKPASAPAAKPLQATARPQTQTQKPATASSGPTQSKPPAVSQNKPTPAPVRTQPQVTKPAHTPSQAAPSASRPVSPPTHQHAHESSKPAHPQVHKLPQSQVIHSHQSHTAKSTSSEKQTHS